MAQLDSYNYDQPKEERVLLTERTLRMQLDLLNLYVGLVSVGLRYSFFLEHQT